MLSKDFTKEDCRQFIAQLLFKPDVCNNANPEFIGIELECFPYIKNVQNKIETVDFCGNEKSLVNALIKVSNNSSGIVQNLNHVNLNNPDDPGLIRIEFANGSSFHFEPGGQVEISTMPSNSIVELEIHLCQMQDILREVSDETGIQFAQYGTNPWFTADAIGMPASKPRYRALANYLDSIGCYGRQMMVQTCSLQVNVDLGKDVETRLKRIVAANLLAPFATAIFANSSVVGGQTNRFKSYRSYIWQHLDNTRTGVLPLFQNDELPTIEQIADAYCDFVLQAPLIFLPELGDKVLPKAYTFEYFLSHSIGGLQPTEQHWKDQLSLLFPEVRLKNYLELRSVDAPPVQWQMVPAIFYCGLLYQSKSLDKVLELLLPNGKQLSVYMQDAVYGLASDKIYELSKSIIRIALEGIEALPEGYLSANHVSLFNHFVEKFTEQRKTLADDNMVKA